MTLHAAKGLEFDVVFLPGWEEGLFPHQRALDEGGMAALEEERRLAYVGLTRARHRVYISFAANRRIHNQWQSAIPSRFIDELPRDRVEVMTEPGLYGGYDETHRPFQEMRSGFGYAGAGGPPHEGRLNAARLARAPTIEGEARRLDSGRPSPSFGAGQRVFHQKFGNGSVVAINDDKLKIAFDRAGEKMVIASFVEPVGA